MKPLPGDAEVVALAGEVTGRVEYARHRTLRAEWARDLLERLQDWIASLALMRETEPLAFWSLLLGLLLVAALLIAHIVWALRAALRAPAPEPSPEAPRKTGFLERAEAFAQSGAHLEAAHQLLLASLEYVARRRVVELHPDDGNGRVCEKLRVAALPEPLRARLVGLIGETQRAWFGRRQGGEALYRQWQAAFGELRRRV